MTSREFGEKRAKLIADARVIIDSVEDGSDLSAEQQAQVDQMFADADALKEQASSAERKEKLERAEAELKESQGRKVSIGTRFHNGEITKADRNFALRSWALSHHGQLSVEDELKASNAGVFARSPAISLSRSLTKGSNAGGGYTVPQQMANNIIEKLKFYNDVRIISDEINTDTGVDYPMPSVEDDNVAVRHDEGDTITTSGADPVFGRVVFKAWDFSSTCVKVSNTLLRDSEQDLETILTNLLTRRISKKQCYDSINGNGTTTFEGLNEGDITVNLASGNAMTLAKLQTLIHSVDRFYRKNGSFVMSDSTLLAVKLLVDTTGRPLWEPSLLASEPDKLLGFPVYVANDMTDFASPGDGLPLVAFGDFKEGYAYRNVVPSLQVVKLTENFALTNETGFALLQSADARFKNKDAIKLLASYDAP